MVFKFKPSMYPKLAAAVGGLAGYYTFYCDNKLSSLSWMLPNSSPLPQMPWDWNWDKREPFSLISKKLKSKSNKSESEKDEEPCLVSTATRHMIFIRHGQYNLEGINDDQRILTKLGREQAALTGKRLNELSWNYTRYVHSTMKRATETAEIIYNNLDNKNHSIDYIEKCDLLREGAPIRPEPSVGSWKAEMHIMKLLPMFQKYFSEGARIEAAFRKYFHRAPPTQTKNSFEIYVCHANVIRYFVCRALQLAPDAWLRLSLHNGSVTVLTIRPDGRVSLKMLGDCGFMPVDKLTFT